MDYFMSLFQIMSCLIWQKLSLNLFQISTCIYYLTKGMRDGVSYISKRYNQANNKYLKSDGPKQESKHIKYLGTNNLCGYAMSTFLHCQQVDLNGLILKTLIQINTAAIVPKNAFYKLILSILKNYEDYMMIILWVQVN